MSVTIKFPEEICFAFSPNYIEIEGATDSSATIIIEGEKDATFSVGIVDGKAKIYVSRWLQLLFGDPLAHKRWNNFSMEVRLPSESSSHYSEHQVIWGALEPVKRMGTIGSYVYDPEEVYFVRRVRWFKNFPFKISIFETTDSTFQIRYDNNGYASAQNFQENGYNDLDIQNAMPNAKRLVVVKSSGGSTSVFDGSFDYTFKQLTEGTSLVRITIDESKSGYYFRWIDSLGQLQYFLFSPHSNNIKVKNADAIDADIKYSGYYYGGGKRVIGNEKTKTIRCCAMNLTEEEAEYVRSIVYSVFVDLYLGKDKDGEEIWIPCIIDDGTFLNSEKEGLQDFEISAEVPTSQSQSL